MNARRMNARDTRSTSTVLVLSGPDDATARAVIAELRRRGAAVAAVDTGDFPTRLRLAARIAGPAGWSTRLEGLDGELAEVDLDSVSGVLYRRPTRFKVPDGLSDAEQVYAVSEARYGLGGLLASLDALWLNEPGCVARAEYKPLGLQVAARAGLAVPRTLITNDHAAAVEFAKDVGGGVDGRVVCKTLSSIVLQQDGTATLTYTTPVDIAAADPAQIAATAHLFQERVDKTLDVRVVLVGQRAFGFAVHSDSDAGRMDWRTDYPALSYSIIDPPPEVVAAMRSYLHAFGLTFGVFDLAVTQDGWVMYECNPNGEWLWLAEATGAPVAVAFAETLIGGPS
jgi:ATP-grasp ribosomal peptide maturase